MRERRADSAATRSPQSRRRRGTRSAIPHAFQLPTTSTAGVAGSNHQRSQATVMSSCPQRVRSAASDASDSDQLCLQIRDRDAQRVGVAMLVATELAEALPGLLIA